MRGKLNRFKRVLSGFLQVSGHVPKHAAEMAWRRAPLIVATVLVRSAKPPLS